MAAFLFHSFSFSSSVLYTFCFLCTCVVLHFLAAVRRNSPTLHIAMAKRPRDADADADVDAGSMHSAVRMRRVLPRPLSPRPVEQIVAAESAKSDAGALVSASIDDTDSKQWDAYYTARYLKFNANTGSEEINGSTEDGHAITNDVLAITDNARILLIELTADEENLLQKATGATGVSGVR